METRIAAMSYQVLARRLRPGDFKGLVGQDHVVRALCNGLDSGRIHHAYLFTGTRGVGKTTIARILAKSLNCEAGVSSTPCGTCSICREIEENRFIDLIEVDAASRTRVDDTRELLENAQYLPSRGRFKVYLIDEVHMLSASSFNAFLKTLEEPPEHVKFLLATTDPRKVPVTVLSRCLQFQLKNIGRDEIARYIAGVLAAEGVEFEPDAVGIIARSARGSMRDALSITDQAIAYGNGALTAADVAAMVGAAGRDETGAVLEALASGDPRQVLAVSEALADKAADFGSVLAELLEALHGMAVGEALGEAQEGALSAEAVQLYYQIALIGYRDLHIGPDPKTGFEMTLLRMLAFAPDAATAARVPAAAVRSPPSVETESSARESAGGASGQADHRADVSGADASEVGEAGEVGDVGDVGMAGQQTMESIAEPGAPARQQAGTGAADGPTAPDTTGNGLCREWYSLVEQLGLKGPDRMIAEHSLLIERRAGSCRLLLDRKHESLLRGGGNRKPGKGAGGAVGRARAPRHRHRRPRTRNAGAAQRAARTGALGGGPAATGGERHGALPHRHLRRHPRGRPSTESRRCRGRGGEPMSMKGLGDLFKQAQQVQQKIEAMQAEIASLEVTGESGAGLVRVVLNGAHEVKRVHIDPAVLDEGREVLEDLIAAAFNDGARRVESARTEKMSGLAGGFGLPLDKLPF